MEPLWVEAFQSVIGKRIYGLVVAQNPESPKCQTFLIFDDGTHYELYGSDFQGCKGIDRGGFDEVREHLRARAGTEILLESIAE
jgi:hypothetical protein